MRRLIQVFMAIALLPISVASAAEYRRITLLDGRVLVAQIIDAEDTTMWLQTPMGRMKIDMLEVTQFENITRMDYEDEPPHTAVLLPFTPGNSSDQENARIVRDLVQTHIEQMPGIDVIRAEDFIQRLGEESATTLRSCGRDLQCAIAILAPMGVDVLLHGSLTTNGQQLDIEIRAVLSSAPELDPQVQYQNQGSAGLSSKTAIQLLDIFDIEEPSKVINIPDPDLGSQLTQKAPSVQTESTADAEASKGKGNDNELKRSFLNRQTTQTTEATDDLLVKRSTLIPIPGLPALIQRDLKSFGLSWGVAVPTTAGMVGLIGASSYRASQFNVLSILTYYAITVGVNRRFGLQPSPHETINSPDSPVESASLQTKFRD